MYARNIDDHDSDTGFSMIEMSYFCIYCGKTFKIKPLEFYIAFRLNYLTFACSCFKNISIYFTEYVWDHYRFKFYLRGQKAKYLISGLNLIAEVIFIDFVPKTHESGMLTYVPLVKYNGKEIIIDEQCLFPHSLSKREILKYEKYGERA